MLMNTLKLFTQSSFDITNTQLTGNVCVWSEADIARGLWGC